MVHPANVKDYRIRRACTGGTIPIMNFEKHYLQSLTEKVINCCEEVHQILGPGLVETIYCEALAHEFQLNRIAYSRQPNGREPYTFVARDGIDFLVDNTIILVVARKYTFPVNRREQLAGCLKQMNKKIGLIVNFHTEKMCDGIFKMVN